MKGVHRPFGFGPGEAGLVMRRREALAAVALLPLACAPSPARPEATGAACMLSPENVEGPFYLEDAHVRGDIREDRPGLPFILDATVIDARTCKPLGGAAVDLWHCDVSGAYSGFVEDSVHPRFPGGPGGPGMGPPPGRPPGPPPFDPGHAPPRPRPTDSARFLRGTQLSDAYGRVRFTTIYPGWYAGRAVHIHLRVRTGGAVRGEMYDGGHLAHTGQLFLPEALSDEVFAQGPYAAHAGRRMRQAEDGIFAHGGGSGLLAPTASGGGYLATTTIGVDPRASRVPMR
jgi:protocatechuate 3,4-dioxygenase beta subunit